MATSCHNWDDEHFTLANIPYGVASRSKHSARRIVTRVQDKIYFILELIQHGLLREIPAQAHHTLLQDDLNQFASLSKAVQRTVRLALQSLLMQATTGNLLDSEQQRLSECTSAAHEITMHLPIKIGDFSDFSASLHHVLNAGEAIFGKRVLPPGFLHFPIGYTGRTSSIVKSGTPIRRPLGQHRSPGSEKVDFGPSKAVDFELEIACVIGTPSVLGEAVHIQNAEEHIFGFVLLNDWSARDIQALEMNPLGPLNGKSFATTISPWIVTADALHQYRMSMPQEKSEVAPYLRDVNTLGLYNIDLQVQLMSKSSSVMETISHSNMDCLYWNFRDMIAHQTINGCPLRNGDLLATGTISGPAAKSLGCLLEITRGGKTPLIMEDGSERTYLQDFDMVRLTGWAGVLGSDQCVGFGEALGVLTPAQDHAYSAQPSD